MIIGGSGPVDRNGDVGHTGHVEMAGRPPHCCRLRVDPLRQADIRSDRTRPVRRRAAYRRAAYRRADDVRLSGGVGDRTFDEAFVQQARDAAAYLTEQPGTDPARLVLVGHSEGGMVALSVARRPGDPGTARPGLIEPSYTRISTSWTGRSRKIAAAAISADDVAALEEWTRAGIAGDPFAGAAVPATVTATATGRRRCRCAAADGDRVLCLSALPQSAGQDRRDEIDPVALASRVPGGAGSVPVTCGTKRFQHTCAAGGAPGSGVSALAAAFRPTVARWPD